MGEQRQSVSFTIAYNGFDYEITAYPILYNQGQENEYPSQNCEFKIHMPDGSWIESDFYPESDDLFSIEFEDGLADLLSTKLLNITKHKIYHK